MILFQELERQSSIVMSREDESSKGSNLPEVIIRVDIRKRRNLWSNNRDISSINFREMFLLKIRIRN